MIASEKQKYHIALDRNYAKKLFSNFFETGLVLGLTSSIIMYFGNYYVSLYHQKFRVQKIINDKIKIHSKKNESSEYIFNKKDIHLENIGKTIEKLDKVEGTTHNILLYGPHGTGKTFFLECLCQQAGITYYPLTEIVRQVMTIKEMRDSPVDIAFQYIAEDVKKRKKRGFFKNKTSFKFAIFIDELPELFYAQDLRSIESLFLMYFGNTTTDLSDVLLFATSNKEIGELPEKIISRIDIKHRMGYSAKKTSIIFQDKVDNQRWKNISEKYSETIEENSKKVGNILNAINRIISLYKKELEEKISTLLVKNDPNHRFVPFFVSDKVGVIFKKEITLKKKLKTLEKTLEKISIDNFTRGKQIKLSIRDSKNINSNLDSTKSEKIDNQDWFNEFNTLLIGYEEIQTIKTLNDYSPSHYESVEISAESLQEEFNDFVKKIANR